MTLEAVLKLCVFLTAFIMAVNCLAYAQPEISTTAALSSSTEVSSAATELKEPASASALTSTSAVASNTPPSDSLGETATTAPAAVAIPAAPASADVATSVSLPNGGYYQVLNQGSGDAPTTTQTLILHYTLFLTSGTKVESSRDAEFPVPLKLKLGQGDFIKGFEVGVEGMKIGETRRIFVPSSQGYGSTGKGPIPANTDLIFETELVDIR